MEGLADLGFDVPTLIAQVVNFAVLFVLLYMFAYKPILQMLDGRSRKIKESLEQAEVLKQQTASAEEEIKKQLALAGKEGQERIERAVQAGEEMKRKAEQEARQEAEALLARARSEIQRERDEAIGELRKEFADITIMAAEKVIEKSLDKQAHRELIDRVLEESSGLKR